MFFNSGYIWSLIDENQQLILITFYYTQRGQEKSFLTKKTDEHFNFGYL